MASTALFRDDSYQKSCSATVTDVNDRGGIILDQTVFYATGGGQPGDSGLLKLEDGKTIPIATTVYGDERTIIHVPENQDLMPSIGDKIYCEIDWSRRFKHMRAHTLLHLLLSLVPFPITGGQMNEEGGRLDFDISDPDKVSKEGLTEGINQLIQENHPISYSWITDEELNAKPDLVRTMSVKPPMGTGKVRLVAIGENGTVDLQPCGGTHVASTIEIGAAKVTKIEKKGKINRRIRVALVN